MHLPHYTNAGDAWRICSLVDARCSLCSRSSVVRKCYQTLPDERKLVMYGATLVHKQSSEMIHRELSALNTGVHVGVKLNKCNALHKYWADALTQIAVVLLCCQQLKTEILWMWSKIFKISTTNEKVTDNTNVIKYWRINSNLSNGDLILPVTQARQTIWHTISFRHVAL